MVDEGFPVTANAFASNLRGTQDAIVTILDENGSSLVYSTYLGGDSTDSGWGIALGPNGLVYVTGTTRSADDPDTPADEGFPTTPDAIQPQNAGRSDVFAVVFAVVFDPADENADPLVDLEFSTYLGGSGDEDRGLAIAADGMGGVYLAGTTFSTNFTTTPGTPSSQTSRLAPVPRKRTGTSHSRAVLATAASSDSSRGSMRNSAGPPILSVVWVDREWS